MKTKLIASIPHETVSHKTLFKMRDMVSAYFCGSLITLRCNMENKRITVYDIHNANGLIAGFRLRVKGSRIRFEEITE